jgi:cysteine desulfurase
MNLVYLDHASTTPCREEVWAAMRPYALFDYGNDNSLHSLGRSARQAVDKARQDIADVLRCESNEIFFSTGGSDSDNLAIRGIANQRRRGHVITTKVEHLAVLNACASLEAEGFKVTYLDVDDYGRVTPERVTGAMRKDTMLVSIGHTNNEVGTIQPIAEIAKRVKARNSDVVFHTDAIQAVGHEEIDVRALGVDLLSFTAQKFYGPKGIGGLYIRDGVRVKPQIVGMREKRGQEVGTVSVPLVVGMALALKLASRELKSEKASWTPLRDQIIAGLLLIPDSRLNGHPSERLSTNISVCFLGINGEDVVLQLDRIGICAATGSACTSGRVEPSHVLTAMGLPRRWALGALRLSLGHACAGLDPNRLVEQIRNIVEQLRSTSYTPNLDRLSQSSMRSELIA